jgi:flagellar hook-associated protein 3 FlgL
MTRISTYLFHQRATASMLDNQSRLSKTQLQLATGKRILTPSDDPAGATKTLDLQRYLETNKQFLSNMGFARARLETQETALASVTDLLQRANELAIQGNNATTSQASRDGIAAEVDQLLEQMLALANTRDSNGEYLFGGLRRDATGFPNPDDGLFYSPSDGQFTYQGTVERRNLQVSEDRRLADADTGQDIFMGAMPDGSDSAFGVLYEFAVDLRSGADLSGSIADIGTAMERVLEIRARGGARLNALDDLENINADLAVTLEAELSEVKDLDYAEAVSRMNRQLLAFQASQQSYARLSQLSLFNYL